MSSRSLGLTDTVYTYMLNNSLRESEACSALRKATEDIEYSTMQVSPEQGQFMALLVSLLQVRKAIEVGTIRGTAPMSPKFYPKKECLSHATYPKSDSRRSTYWEHLVLQKKLTCVSHLPSIHSPHCKKRRNL